MSPETEKIIQNPCSIQEAKEILGAKNVFGPEEWKKFLGDKIQLEKIPEIPWSKEELKNPGLLQEHFLFLGLDQLEGKPFTLLTWHNLQKDKDHPKFWLDKKEKSGPWWQHEDFAKETCKFRWYFIPVGLVKELTSKYSSKEYTETITLVYESLHLSERITGNFVYYFLNGSYLDSKSLVDIRTDYNSNLGYICIGINSDNLGLYIRGGKFDQLKNAGISVSRSMVDLDTLKKRTENARAMERMMEEKDEEQRYLTRDN